MLEEIPQPYEASAHFASPLLSRMDLVSLEAVICAELREIFPFNAHSLYFPRPHPENETREAEYLAREHKLLLPLRQRGGEFLGFFVARLPKGIKIRPILPVLPKLAGLCLDKAALFRQGLREPITGLHNARALLDALTSGLERLALLLAAKPGLNLPRTAPWLEYELKDAAGIHSGQFCLLSIRLGGLRQCIRDYGHLRVEGLLALLGQELEKSQPEQAFSARSGEDELALFLPGEGPVSGRKIGLDLVDRLAKVETRDTLTDRACRISPALGYLYCPQDLRGLEGLTPAEQARRLLDRARFAADLALTNGAGDLAYARILKEGGRVLAAQPFSRLLVSLGAAAGARPGQYFTILGPGPAFLYKADIRLLETADQESLAEILHLEDPASLPVKGDVLRPATSGYEEEQLYEADEDAKRERLPAGRSGRGNAMPLEDFLLHWRLEREKHPAFALALGRFSPLPLEEASPGSNPKEFLDKAAEHCRTFWGSDLLLGRYALNSLIFFLPGTLPETGFGPDLTRRFTALLTSLEQDLHLEATFGLALHPFLDFHPADGLENAQKALRYALLLPSPKVGGLDSLALNINADRLYHLGGLEHTLEAIAEYRRALLCDPDNIPAWNSLSIALTGLGRQDEARRGLEEALRREPGDFNTLYNLGTLLQSLRAFAEARRHYRRCLDLDENNVFVLHRLGRIAEEEGHTTEAEKYYCRAGGIAGGEGLARRGLARLAIRQGQTQAAREILHEALMEDPGDALALWMLAGLFLDAGEDPVVAESLARRSVALRPDLREGWLALARALEASGRKGAAREALSRAEGL